MQKTFIGNFNSGHRHWNIGPQIGTNQLDLIHNITENGLRHASGPVQANLTSVIFILLMCVTEDPCFWESDFYLWTLCLRILGIKFPSYLFVKQNTESQMVRCLYPIQLQYALLDVDLEHIFFSLPYHFIFGLIQ